MKKKCRSTVQTRYYQSYNDDFVKSSNQDFELPDNYIWINNSIWHRLASAFVYLLGLIFSFCYCRLYLRIKIKNRAILKRYKKSGCFLYANHTQPLGDAFIPGRVITPKRCYIVAGTANLGIPLLGRFLPLLGALPVPDSIGGLKKLHQAIGQRVMTGNCIVIYPEGHVWPWYTGIRPYSTASFSYPVAYHAPSFCMTATYQQRKYRKRPKMTIYLDGPFYPDRQLSKKAQKELLRKDIHNCMIKRSSNSYSEYIRYLKGGT